jgi:hypothetical protein
LGQSLGKLPFEAGYLAVFFRRQGGGVNRYADPEGLWLEQGTEQTLMAGFGLASDQEDGKSGH